MTHEDKSEGTVTVTEPTPRQETAITGGTLEDDKTDGNFLILGRYDGTSKLNFISSYGGTDTGSNMDGQDHAFSYGAFGTKNSMSFKLIPPLSPNPTPIKSVPITYYKTKHALMNVGGQPIKIQDSDEASDITEIRLVNASCKGIGVDGVNVETEKSATDSIDMIGEGLRITSRFR